MSAIAGSRSKSLLPARVLLLLGLVLLIGSALWLVFGQSSASETAAGAPIVPASSSEPIAEPAQLAEPDADVARTAGATTESAASRTAAAAMATLRIRVVTKDRGEPVAGAKVTALLLVGGSDASLRNARSVTGADGFVEYQVAAGQPSRFHVDAPAARITSLQVGALASGELCDVVVEVDGSPLFVICGRVVTAGTNAPIAGAVVELVPGITASTSASDGSFRAELPPGHADGFTLRAKGFGPRWVVAVSGHESPEKALEIALDAGSALEVHVVVADGSPVPDASVLLRATRSDLRIGGTWSMVTRGAVTWTAVADVTGVARFEDLPPNVVLQGELSRGALVAAAAPARVTLMPGEARVVRWYFGAGAELRGVVVEADGTRAASIQVCLQPATSDEPTMFHGFDMSKSRRYAWTDAEGTFRFYAIPLGRYWIGPSAQSQRDPSTDPAPFGQRIDVVDGSNDEVVIRLQRGLTIQGVVLGADGTPAPGGHVQAVGMDAGVSLHTQSGSSGEFVVGPLIPGRWTLVALNPPAHADSLPVEAECGATGVVLQHRGGGTIHVRVVGRDGTAVPDVMVLCVDSARSGHMQPTGTLGTTEFAVLAGEPTTLSCATSDGRWAAAKDIRADGTRPVPVDLVLEPGVRAQFHCATDLPRAAAWVRWNDVSVGFVEMGGGRTVTATLPIGRVTLVMAASNREPVEHEVLVEAGTSPEFTFDGAWR